MNYMKWVIQLNIFVFSNKLSNVTIITIFSLPRSLRPSGLLYSRASVRRVFQKFFVPLVTNGFLSGAF